jgi:hypothetical protein
VFQLAVIVDGAVAALPPVVSKERLMSDQPKQFGGVAQKLPRNLLHLRIFYVPEHIRDLWARRARLH